MTPEEADKLGRDILLDRVSYKLCLAKLFLSKIDIDVPLDYNKKHFALESNVESFLFYSNLAIENFVYNINIHFSDIIPRSKYSIHELERSSSLIKNVNMVSGDGRWYDGLSIYSLRKKLDTSITEQKIVQQIIDDYFSTPKEVSSNQFDLTHSPLYVLRELRNFVAHNPIINRKAIRGSVDLTLFRFLIDLEHYSPAQPRNNPPQPEKIGTKIALNEERPQTYFQQFFDALCDFIDDICKIIPKVKPANHYKTLDISKLEFLLS